MWHTPTLFIAIDNDVGSSHKRELTENGDGYQKSFNPTMEIWAEREEGRIAAWAATGDEVGPPSLILSRSQLTDQLYVVYSRETGMILSDRALYSIDVSCSTSYYVCFFN